ncbi:MAG TPA: penicillin-binding transpeptidase domain-containing protein, partial [Verrucomicrobiaceae bacterium]
VAGKTGTAQFWRLEQHKDGSVSSEKDNHTLFICFAPYVNPKYAICVFLQGGKSGGGCSAPIGKRVMEQALSLEQGYTVALAPVNEVSGNFNHIETVSFDGVAPIALAPHEQDNDTGSDVDVPKPTKVAREKPVQANIKHDADEEGSRAINNKQRPPRRAVPQAPGPGNAPQEPEKKPSFLKRLFGH